MYFQIVLFSVIFLASCSTVMSEGGPVQESVIHRNQKAIITNDNGTVEYVYSGETKRRIIIGDGSKELDMIARQKRFRGKLGLYNPGERWFSDGRREARIVVVEGEMHFETMQDALKYLRQGSEFMDWQSNDQGYVGGFSMSPERNQINVTLYRYFINDKPISNLPEGNGSVTIK